MRPIRLLTRFLVSFICGLALSTPLVAQSDAEKATASLQGPRVRTVKGTVLDPAKAGYYRVVLASSAFTHDDLCWRDSTERERLKKLAPSIWSIALKTKKDWGSAVSLVFDGTHPDFEATGFKPNLWAKFFAVQIDGSAPQDCQVSRADFSTFESPLIPFYESANPTIAYVQFTTWYNDVKDRGRVDALVRGGSALLAITGLPVGVLQPATPALVDVIKDKIDKKRVANYVTELSPINPDKVEAQGFVGLREPPSLLTGNEPRVAVKLVPVASVFAPQAMSFDTVDMSGYTAADILQRSISVRAADGTYTQSLLDALIGAKTAGLNSMLTDATDAGASSLCNQLALSLVNEFKFSTTDAAIILYGAALQRKESRLTKNLRDLSCIASRENLLGRVKIKLLAAAAAVSAVPGASAPIGKEEMRDRMDVFAQFRATPLDSLPDSNWDIFSFPMTVYDASDKLGLQDQQATFTAEARTGLKSLFDEKTTRVGCWAYFEAPPLSFAPGLGSAIDATSTSPVRKGAALVMLASGETEILQFRFNGDAVRQRIDGLAFVKTDSAAKAQMLGNQNCKPGVAGREWIQSFLRP